jgi:SAM-dependent methyltransferase
MVRSVQPNTVVDLGCGDGGLLQILKSQGISCWGYDFQPSNAQGWKERNVIAYQADIFNTDFSEVQWGDVAVATEVLEHLDDPHGAVHDISYKSKYLVASSPVNERPGDGACDSHIWAWDLEGYAALLAPHFTVIQQKVVDWNQLILGRSRYV